MADSKQRKVIIAENTFLPTYIKEHIAHALFDNLRVPSVAFTPSSLLALAACGRITGLVVDVGWLETTITPVRTSTRTLCDLMLTGLRCTIPGRFFPYHARPLWLGAVYIHD